MAHIVLVPGFWLGAWAWEKVARPLREAGHDVHAVTLTGLGDRVHLAGPGVDLETHTTDIVNVIVFADLHEVILVGHSGAGIPVTQAADRIPERVARVVYVDIGPLADGMAADRHATAGGPQEEVEKRVAAEGDGWKIPPPGFAEASEDPVDLAGLSEDDLALLRAAERPAAVRDGDAADAAVTARPVPETLVACMFPEAALRRMFADGHPMYAGFGPDPQVVPLPTGHYPMFSRPADTARVLGSLV